MLNLVVKDLYLQKKLIGIYLIIFLLLFPVFKKSSDNIITIISFLTYILTIESFKLEQRNKSYYIVNSFPVTRNDIVYSKYMCSLFYCVFAFLLVEIVCIMGNYLGVEIYTFNITYPIMIKSFLSALILIFFILPILLKESYIKAYYISGIVFVIVHISTIIGNHLLVQSNISTFLILIGYILTTIILFFISLNLSLKIYNIKDL